MGEVAKNALIGKRDDGPGGGLGRPNNCGGNLGSCSYITDDGYAARLVNTDGGWGFFGALMECIGSLNADMPKSVRFHHRGDMRIPNGGAKNNSNPNRLIGLDSVHGRIVNIAGLKHAGKSSTLHRLGKFFSKYFGDFEQFETIDVGNIYRAYAYHIMQLRQQYGGEVVKSGENIVDCLSSAKVESTNGKIYLNGEPLDEYAVLHRHDVTESLSKLLKDTKVFAFLREQDRRIIQSISGDKWIFVSSRLFYPHAVINIFMTADLDLRAQDERQEHNISLPEARKRVLRHDEDDDRVQELLGKYSEMFTVIDTSVDHSNRDGITEKVCEVVNRNRFRGQSRNCLPDGGQKPQNPQYLRGENPFAASSSNIGGDGSLFKLLKTNAARCGVGLGGLAWRYYGGRGGGAGEKDDSGLSQIDTFSRWGLTIRELISGSRRSILINTWRCPFSRCFLAYSMLSLLNWSLSLSRKTTCASGGILLANSDSGLARRYRSNSQLKVLWSFQNFSSVTLLHLLKEMMAIKFPVHIQVFFGKGQDLVIVQSKQGCLFYLSLSPKIISMCIAMSSIITNHSMPPTFVMDFQLDSKASDFPFDVAMIMPLAAIRRIQGNKISSFDIQHLTSTSKYTAKRPKSQAESGFAPTNPAPQRLLGSLHLHNGAAYAARSREMCDANDGWDEGLKVHLAGCLPGGLGGPMWRHYGGGGGRAKYFFRARSGSRLPKGQAEREALIRKEIRGAKPIPQYKRRYIMDVLKEAQALLELKKANPKIIDLLQESTQKEIYTAAMPNFYGRLGKNKLYFAQDLLKFGRYKNTRWLKYRGQLLVAFIYTAAAQSGKSNMASEKFALKCVVDDARPLDSGVEVLTDDSMTVESIIGMFGWEERHGNGDAAAKCYALYQQAKSKFVNLLWGLYINSDFFNFAYDKEKAPFGRIFNHALLLSLADYCYKGGYRRTEDSASYESQLRFVQGKLQRRGKTSQLKEIIKELMVRLDIPNPEQINSMSLRKLIETGMYSQIVEKGLAYLKSLLRKKVTDIHQLKPWDCAYYRGEVRLIKVVNYGIGFYVYDSLPAGSTDKVFLEEEMPKLELIVFPQHRKSRSRTVSRRRR